jgi:hypothetical protein
MVNYYSFGALAQAAQLAHLDPLAPIAITLDASDVAVEGILEQWCERVWQPLAFMSTKLNDARRKYTTFAKATKSY